MNTLLRALIIWILMMLIEMIHGIARRLLLEPLIGDLNARQIAVFTGSVLIIIIAFAFIRWLKEAVTTQLLLVGAMWVILTLLFEVMIGRFVMDLTWARIFEEYDLRNGGLMPIGLLVLFLSPLVTAKIRSNSSRSIATIVDHTKHINISN